MLQNIDGAGEGTGVVIHDILRHGSKQKSLMSRLGHWAPTTPTSSRSTFATRPKRPESLTSREQEILQLIWTGLKNKETAHQLNLSVKTVEAHRANMMKKLRVSNTAQLLKIALYEGILKLR